MENNQNNLTEDEQKQFQEYMRRKRTEEAQATVGRIECDCLSAYAEKSTLKQLCKDGDRLGIGAIVVLPSVVKPCVGFLGKDPKCSLIAAISYPHGGDTTDVKVAAVKRAIKDGVDEAEVYAPLAYLKEGNFGYFKRECKKLKKASKTRALRIVFDGSALGESELAKSCAIAADCGVNMIRISRASDAQLVQRVKSNLKDKCLFKTDGAETAAGFQQAVVFGADAVCCKNATEIASLLLSEIQ